MRSVLELTAEKRRATGETILKQCLVTSPYKLLTIPEPRVKRHGYLYAMQMSASPGLLGGDEFTATVRLHPGSRLFLATQAFNRILTMKKGEKATQKFTAILESGAGLYYLPHPTVLHQDADFTQTLTLDIKEDNRALIGDMMIAGRISRGEIYDFAHFFGKTRVIIENETVLEDRLSWEPRAMNLHHLGQLHDFTHLLSLYYVDTERLLSGKTVELLRDTLAALNLPLEFGASQIHPGVIIIKAVARQAEVLTQVAERVSQFYFTSLRN